MKWKNFLKGFLLSVIFLKGYILFPASKPEIEKTIGEIKKQIFSLPFKKTENPDMIFQISGSETSLSEENINLKNWRLNLKSRTLV